MVGKVATVAATGLRMNSVRDPRQLRVAGKPDILVNVNANMHVLLRSFRGLRSARLLLRPAR